MRQHRQLYISALRRTLAAEASEAMEPLQRSRQRKPKEDYLICSHRHTIGVAQALTTG